MLNEFKKFAMRGNIMDLAVGVIIGGAFQKIVTSLVNDIIMPTISVITGKVDYSDLCITIGNASIKYGSFLTSVLDFLIIAFSIFIMIKYINKMNSKLGEINEKNKENVKQSKLFKKLKKKLKIKEKQTEEKAPAPTTKTCPYCFSEINIKATRCPNCTSILEEIKEETIPENNNDNTTACSDNIEK